ncbi:MAG: CapA family protein [Bacillota bacterium]
MLRPRLAPGRFEQTRARLRLTPAGLPVRRPVSAKAALVGLLLLLTAAVFLAGGAFLYDRLALVGRLGLADRLALSAGSSNAGPTVNVALAGDILLDRGVARQIEAHGLSYPLEGVASLLRAADLAFANLEGPITDQGGPLPKEFVFRAPPKAALALKRAGLDLVSLANNHTFDYGPEGLADTVARLEGQGVATVGAGPDRATARRSRVIELRGLKLAFLAFNGFPNEVLAPVLTEPSVAALETETMTDEVAAARRQADMVIVSLHWGEEFSQVPTEGQRRLAREIIDAGATLVIGHHPHVLQPIEEYHGGLIAYSLGNLVFDQNRPETAQSALLMVRLDHTGLRGWDVIPLTISECRPRPATGPAAVAVRAALGAR